LIASPVALNPPSIPGVEQLAAFCRSKYGKTLGVDTVPRIIADYALNQGISMDKARAVPLAVASDVLAPRINPVHCLIEDLDQFIRAIWRCHHADSREKMREALVTWRTVKDPFWQKYRIPVEAARGLADPALAFCSRAGLRSEQDVAIVENAAHYATELAKLTRPVAIPSVYSYEKEMESQWERQGEFLDAAVRAQDRLRQLAARTGHAWEWNGLLPWDHPMSVEAEDALPDDADQVEDREAATGDGRGQTPVAVRWHQWALGAEYPGKWQLFRLVRGAWQHRGVLNTRKGLQHKLLAAFGQGKGLLQEEDAIRLWHEKPTRIDRSRIRRLLTSEISRLRTLIRTRISRAVGVTGHKTDPLPRHADPPLWKTEIHIGYALTQDNTTFGGENRFRFVPCDESVS
jgi:hypothetical protein